MLNNTANFLVEANVIHALRSVEFYECRQRLIELYKTKSANLELWKSTNILPTEDRPHVVCFKITD